jgi:glycine cleavage system aminomethyltransferase T
MSWRCRQAIGEAVASAIMHAGQPHGILPYGLEALSSMRVEKGFITHNEINGRHTAGDVGLGRMASKKKDYIGRMMSEREGLNDPDRMQLVGIRPLDPASASGLALTCWPQRQAVNEATDQGYVSSVAWSPTLDSWIGLGMLKRGRERHGERLMCGTGCAKSMSRRRCATRCSSIRTGRRPMPDIVPSRIAAGARAAPRAAMAGRCRKAPA